MSDVSWNTIRQRVYERANGCCEYCQTCEVNTGQTMHVDHIIPNGGNSLENLCLSYWNCNTSKQNVTEAIDPKSGEIFPLFNPRTQKWDEYFEWLDNGVLVHGITAIGRATVKRLKMNRTRIIIARQRWVKSDFHPPD